jgi:hypothetical protein
VAIAGKFLEKRHPRSLGLNLHFIVFDKGFGNQAFSGSFIRKMSPSPLVIGDRPSVLEVLCEGPDAELPRLFLNLSPANLFSMRPRAGCGAIIGAVFYHLLYIAALR